MIAVNWVCSDEGRLGVPLLTLVPLLSVGTLWGQPWGRERYDTKLWMRDLMEGAAYLPK